MENISQNANQKILTDEQGRPIICVRSDHGIHFMIMEKSIADVAETDSNGVVGLTNYYSPLGPGDTGYDSTIKNYVNYENTTDKSVYKDRAEDLENKIKSFDSTYSYRLFEYFVAQEGTKIEFAELADGTDLVELVKNYISVQREYNQWNTAETMNSSWRTYLELINLQEANRIDERLIPETCALKFKEGNSDDEFKSGGLCYYAK